MDDPAGSGPAYCQRCGRRQDGGSNFCPGCGSPLSAGPVGAIQPARGSRSGLSALS